jgi:electron transfer flavoprotein beta subunit
LKIIVCIKQVPSSNEVRLDPVTKTIIRDGDQSVTNPYDSYGLELAIQLKESLGGEISVLSMGIPATKRLLRDALSRGADRALLLTDRAFAGSDTLSTSYVLSLGIKKLGDFDLILCGKMAIDGDTAQIGPELAEHLKIPHVTEVLKIIKHPTARSSAFASSATNSRSCASGCRPCSPSPRTINLPRLPSIVGLAYGLSAPLETADAEALGADRRRCGLDGSPTQVIRTAVPTRGADCVKLTGSPHEQASALLDMISEEL